MVVMVLERVSTEIVAPSATLIEGVKREVKAEVPPVTKVPLVACTVLEKVTGVPSWRFLMLRREPEKV